eukprot:TRINITY_DN2096_c0_g2_i1.p1 TRINITY_DN2096_c0_g2~~TRINITY_DN2096_c0_g2_i1.p1  ORF type:complete len:353 (-),score=22.42 TRINITY_DN2096_c0_g2_i1:188-1246(-)
MAELCCIGRTDPDENKFGISDSVCNILGFTLLYVVVCGALSYRLSISAFFFCVLFVLAAAMLSSESLERGHPASWSLYLIGGIWSVLACSVGVVNYHTFYAPYLEAVKGQEYGDLSANSIARAHADGGILHFDDSTLVDSTRSLGLLSHGVSYCVAPVLDMTSERLSPAGAPSSTLPLQIQFWAIGVDCCAARGYFSCDDAAAASARSAFVVHRLEDSMESDMFAPRSHYDEFRRAVDAATALYGLSSAEDPVLVRWVNFPRKILANELRSSVYLWLGSTLGVLIASALIWLPIHNYWQQKLENAYMQAKLATANYQATLARMTPKPRSDAAAASAQTSAASNKDSSGFGLF